MCLNLFTHFEAVWNPALWLGLTSQRPSHRFPYPWARDGASVGPTPTTHVVVPPPPLKIHRSSSCPPFVPPLSTCPTHREAPQHPPLHVLSEHDHRRGASSSDFGRSAAAAEAFVSEHRRELESRHFCHVSPLPSTLLCYRTLPPLPSTIAPACRRWTAVTKLWTTTSPSRAFPYEPLPPPPCPASPRYLPRALYEDLIEDSSPMSPWQPRHRACAARSDRAGSPPHRSMWVSRAKMAVGPGQQCPALGWKHGPVLCAVFYFFPFPF
jgi:hypothetical protein